MDESVGVFCRSLSSFCNHLESSCDALKQSVDRRPIPLDSASSTFIQCLNRRVSSTSGDLNLLESMSIGTVSFVELLGHCSEFYKKNQTDIAEIEGQLAEFGCYVPELEADLKGEASDDFSTPLVPKPKTVDADALLEDSLSLKDLGLSDACLATIASEANNNIGSSDDFLRKSTRNYEMNGEQPASKLLEVIQGEVDEDPDLGGASQCLINLSKDDYENLPSYMKTLASFEDLLLAVEKMNSALVQKQKTRAGHFFHQEELALMDLGHKARSYLLLLVRMNRLVVETIDGLISYRVL